ncbi:hypothetical protein [Haloplanus rubicundus]|nr:hypothetical protein [Haloplanus rubicundus]
MQSEFSGDVMDVLGQLFEKGARVLDGDAASAEGSPTDTARQILTSAETVATNKLPDGEFRSRLLHGCERALATLDGDAPAAAEHCRTMAREVASRR